MAGNDLQDQGNRGEGEVGGERGGRVVFVVLCELPLAWRVGFTIVTLSRPSLAITDSACILVNTILRQLYAQSPTAPSHADETPAQANASPSYSLIEFELSAETREPEAIVVFSKASGHFSCFSSYSGQYSKVFEWFFPLLSISVHYQQEVNQDPWCVASLSSFFDSGSFNFEIINFIGTIVDSIHFPADMPSDPQKHNGLDNALPFLSPSTELSENEAVKETSRQWCEHSITRSDLSRCMPNPLQVVPSYECFKGNAECNSTAN